MFLQKGVLKIWRIFTGEHPCRSVTSIKLLWNFIEIILLHVCSPVNLLHLFRTLFPKKTSGGLLLGKKKESSADFRTLTNNYNGRYLRKYLRGHPSKLVSAIFYQVFISQQMIALQKL